MKKKPMDLKRIFWLIIPHRHDFHANYCEYGIRCKKCGRVYYVKYHGGK